jgi:hypothetical protein
MPHNDSLKPPVQTKVKYPLPTLGRAMRYPYLDEGSGIVAVA